MMKRRAVLKLGAATLLLPSGASAETKQPTTSNWSTAASLPINIQELYGSVLQDRLFVAGGIASRLGVPYFTNRVFSYSPLTNSWQEETPLPEDMHHAALVTVNSGGEGERLFLIGGFNGGYTHIWRMRDVVYEYENTEWIERSPLPAPQAEGVLTAIDNDIHIVSGQSPKGAANSKRSDHREVTQHWISTDFTKTWEALAPIPLARNSAAGGWVGNELIITGGRNAAGNFSETHIYDKKEDRWREAAPLPKPQAGTASVVVDDGIIVFGGEIFVPQAGVFANVWRYSHSKDEWLALEDLPTPRHGLSAGRIGNQAYVVGGATQPSGKGTSNVNEALRL